MDKYKEKKNMKKIIVYILSLLCGLCMVFGLGFAFNTSQASADNAQGTTPTLSTTKYKISKSQQHMLLATGIKDYEDVYEVGYAFKNAEGIVKYHAVTNQYYTSITSGNSTWTVEDMFGSEYTGMIVWEIAYDATAGYSYQAYAKVGNRVDGVLHTSDTIVYGTRKDMRAPEYTVQFVAEDMLLDERVISSGEAYGELPEAPDKAYATFKGWYLNAEGTGNALTEETLISLKKDHTVYAVYEDNGTYDFSSASQLSYFFKASNVNYSIENGYLKVTKAGDGENSLAFKADISANSLVEIDVEYVGENLAYASGNQITFLAYTANASGDPDGKMTSVIGNASWDGGWDCKKTTLSVPVTQACAGLKLQFVYNSEANAYFKITSIKIQEYPIIVDFTDEADVNCFASLKNASYSIAHDGEDNYLKVNGKNGSENLLFFKNALKAGAKVEIDIDYIANDETFVNGQNQVTFLADTAKANGGADGKTATVVMGSAPWDGGWNCDETTISFTVAADCAGIRMQFVYNQEAGAYFKINAIRVFYPDYPTYTVSAYADGEITTLAATYNTAYGTLPVAPEKEGFAFKGWYLNADGTGEQITESTLVKLAKNHTLYAVYEEIVEERTEYDFKTADQINDFASKSNGLVEINTAEGYLKLSPVDKTISTDNTPQAEFWFYKELEAGFVVEIDFELVGSIKVKHGIWTYGINENGNDLFNGPAITGWDAKELWNNGKFTATTEITQDCAGLRILARFAKNADAYWKITAVRIIDPNAEVPEVEERTEYDFTTEDQLSDFGKAKNVTYEIVDNYLKVVGTVGSESILVFNRELSAGMKVTVDLEYVASNVAYASGNQITFLTYGANVAGDSDGNTYVVSGNAKWDGGWDCNRVRLVSEITKDCAGLRMQFVMNSEEGAYFKITNVRIYQAGEEIEEIGPENVSIAYDFATQDQAAEFFSLSNGNVEINTAEGYLKLSPVNKTINGNNDPQAEFFFKKILKAGYILQVDFELVGAINVGHGIWTYGANADGSGTLFSGAYYTAWDTPSEWNNGKFTANINITQKCASVRFLVRFAKNADAYWKITGLRILSGEVPTSTVSYEVDGEVVQQSNVTFGEKYTTIPTAPDKANAVFKGWYFNADGTGKQVTANTVVGASKNHTVYAVYDQYYANPDFFEKEQVWNIVNYDNTKITHVRDASGNYLKLAPIDTGDTSNANYPQSEFLFQYPFLKAGMFVEMDFELVGAINVAHGVWTWGANEDGGHLFEGHFITGWDAKELWNNGVFTATTEITQDCAGVRVRVRYANNTKAYWKLTAIRVYDSLDAYCDVPTYAKDKRIDIGGTSWLGTNQTLTYFNGTAGEENFKKLSEAGVTMLAGTFYGNTGSQADETTLLDLAAKYGIGLFFQKNWDGVTIPSYVAHKAFLGYYIDEPAQENLASLKTLQEKWNNSEFGKNGKLLYVNLLPIYSGNIGSNYEAYVQEAIETSGLPIVSFDHYLMYYKEKSGLFESGYETTLSYRTDWLKNFDVASYYANKNDKDLWYTLLTTQHTADGDAILYKDCTVADLTYQMYVAMTYGATNLVHYTFAGTGNYIIDGAIFNQNTGKFTQTYEDVKAASAIIREWDYVFMNFDWKGVSAVTGTSAQTGLINGLSHAVAVNEYGVINSVSSTQDVLVGHFEDENGYKGVMVTNLTIPENATSAEVSISFGSEYKAVMVYQNGTETLVKLQNGSLTLNLASAEGVFLIPVKAK